MTPAQVVNISSGSINQKCPHGSARRFKIINISNSLQQSTFSIINFSGYQIRVFTIALCYIVATMASFQAFTMLAPGAALGARCSSRTFFAILLSFFCLKEKILKFEILSVRWFSDRIIAYCNCFRSSSALLDCSSTLETQLREAWVSLMGNYWINLKTV